MMQPGQYYVGDLCYVLHDEWDEVCRLIITDNQCLDGEFVLEDGRRFAIFGTRYGDGSYQDLEGRDYSVDAGSIGCIRMTDIDLANPRNFLQGGNIIDFPHAFQTSEHNGTIRFGSVSINTADEDEFEYEDEE